MSRAADSRRTGNARQRRGFASVLVLLGLSALAAPATTAQGPVLDEDCVVSLLNRTAPVDADGIWVLPNVPAGIGQVRLRATCVEDGVTIGGQSDYFTVPADGVIRVDEIHFDGQAPVPERLTLSASTTTLTEPGQVLPLTVVALYPDGTSADVTSAAAGTNYVVSNPAVATLSPDGELTAVASGTVIVSALNEGASGFLRLQVVLSGDSDGDGIPDDVEVALGLDPNDPVDALLDPDDDRLTNGDEVAYGSDPNDPDTDGDGLEDGEEVSITGTSPALFDTDGDGLSDGLEIATGSDPLDPGSYNLAEALASMTLRPGSFVLNTNTVYPGEASVALTLEGTLIDGTTIDLTSPARGTSFSSSDLLVCNFGLDAGVVFAGAEGICTITATNSGFSATAEGLVQEFTPRRVSTLNLPSYGNSVAVEDGWAFVAGGPGGLHVLDVNQPRDPRLVTSLPLAGNANDVVLDDGLAYVAGGVAGVHVVDVSVPATPVLVGSVDTPGDAIALRVVGDLVYVADGTTGLQVVSVTDPALPAILGSWDTPGEANGLAVTEGLAVVSTLDSPLEVIDVSVPSAPVGLSTLTPPTSTFDVEVIGSYAYVATSSDVWVVDLGDPLLPRDGGSFGAGIWMIDLLAVGQDRIFSTERELGGIRMPMFDLRQDPSAPFFAGVLEFFPAGPTLTGNGIHVAVDESFTFMTASDGFLVDSKPGTTGPTRLLIGQHAPLEDLEGQVPQVSIVQPADGDQVAAGVPFEVVVEAVDDVGVVDVDLLVDGEVVTRDVLPPYRFVVDPPPAPESVRISATARDFGANKGESAEIQVHVVEGLGTTTVTGSVETSEGGAVAGASVFTSAGGGGLSASDGTFSILGVPATEPSLLAFAAASESGAELRGHSDVVPVVPGGVTDVGPIVLEPLGLPYPGPRSGCCYPTGSVLAMAVADFDQDGIPDVAAATNGSGGVPVAILPGRGDGSFRPRLEVPGSTDLDDVAAGDLDGDGKSDLVVVGRSSNEVRVHLGQGDGTFGPETLYTALNDPSGVAIGDIDRDLIPDLAVAGATEDVLLFFGNGDGSFDPTPGVVTLERPGRKIRLADFDQDGNLDLVTRLDLTLAFGNGDGTFQAPVKLSPAPSVNADYQVFDHQVGDLDRDGLPDILVVEGTNGPKEVNAFLSRGDGTFDQVFGFYAGGDTRSRSLGLGDLNLDAVLDVVVTEQDFLDDDRFAVALGDGAGGFQEQPGVYAGDGYQGDPTILADLDGDGVTDLLAAGDDGVSVFSGLGDGGFRTYERISPITFRGHLVAADLDLDGLDDLVTQGFESISYFLRNTDGTFGDEVTLPLTHSIADLQSIDVTGDGLGDLVAVGDDTVSVFANSGGGVFSGPQEYPTGSYGVYAVIGADVSGDGFLDLVVTNRTIDAIGVLENDGSGLFGPETTYPTGETPGGLTALDFDNDGDLDLAVTAYTDRSVTLLENTGDGIFSGAGSLPVDPGGGSSGAAPVFVAASDLNADGLPDLVTANSAAARFVSVFLNLGGGEFSGEQRYGAGPRAEKVVVLDVDLDGVEDLLTLNGGSSDVSLLRGLGDGTFLEEQRFATCPEPLDMDLIDFDGDGIDDLVVGALQTSEVDILVHQ